jgi:hypothetical protein
MNMNKTVSFELNPVQVVIDVPAGASDKDILKLAEAEAAKQISLKFPSYRYSINEGKSMTLQECESGRMISYNGELGYIFEVKSRKFPLSIALANGRKLQVKPVVLEPLEDESLLGTVWNERPNFMKEIKEWGAGDNAYLPVGKEVRKVILSKVTSTQIHAHELSTSVTGKYMPLKSAHFHLLCDTEEQAKAFIK